MSSPTGPKVNSLLAMGALLTAAFCLGGCEGDGGPPMGTITDPCHPQYGGVLECREGQQGDVGSGDQSPQDVGSEDDGGWSGEEPSEHHFCRLDDGSLEPGWCYIDGECYQSAETHQAESCVICAPDETPVRWSKVDDGVSCTIHEEASVGLCLDGTCSRDWCTCDSLDLCCDGCLASNVGAACQSEGLLPCEESRCDTDGQCITDTIDGYCVVDGQCRHTDNDPSNCGDCGVVCAPDEVCSDGVCQASCGSELANCGGVCADLLSDNAHCGQCNGECPVGSVCIDGVCSPRAASVTVSPAEVTLEPGGSAQLEASVMPEDAHNRAVSWSSSAPAVAAVDAHGLVTAAVNVPNQPATAIITAEADDGGITATSVVTVRVSVDSVTVTPGALSLQLGEQHQLQVWVEPSGATNRNVVWSSSAPSMVSVGLTGRVTAEGVGAARITATAIDGAVQGGCDVVVVATPVTGITMAPEAVMVNKGEQYQLQVIINPPDATDPRVVWQSNAPQFVSVSPAGRVTGLQRGQATVTATSVDGGHSAWSLVSVWVPVDGVEVSPLEETLSPGGSAQFTATVLPDDASEPAVTWASSALEVATVSPGGLVAAGQQAGVAVITASTVEGDFSASAQVRVVIPVGQVLVSPADLTLERGDSHLLNVTVLPSDATDKRVTWRSSAPPVATVDEGGLVQAQGAGSATITVTSVDGDHSALATISVRLSVTGVELDRESVEMLPGGSAVLDASVIPADACNQEVLWTSSSVHVVSVDQAGRMQAHAPGQAVVSVATVDGDHRAQAQVLVIAPSSCLDFRQADPAAESGVYQISPEGIDGEAAVQVYCDMVTDGGGWTLISVVRSDDGAQVIVGGGAYCASLSVQENCKGRMPVAAVNAESQREVLLRTVTGNNWLVYDRWSGSSTSGLRYFTLERPLTASSSCEHPHTCGDALDPHLRVVRTSGFTVNHNALRQWWRYGGWWIGADPSSGNESGRIHATSYTTAHDIRSRSSADGSTSFVSADHQAIFWR